MQDQKILAVIFDMDGLMIDSERMARRAWRRALADHGYALDNALYRELIGRNVRDSRKILRRALGSGFPLEACEQRANKIYRHLSETEDLPIKPGLMELLEFLEDRSVKKAVATSTDGRWAIPKLEKTNLVHRFDTVVTGDRIENGKPRPDIFLAAARDLQVPPGHCLVLEDSPNGIRAAHVAGMVPIMVPDLISPTDEIRDLAFSVASSLSEAKRTISRCIGVDPPQNGSPGKRKASLL